MRTLRRLFLVTLLLPASITLGEIRPSFHLEICSWEATNVVVVTERDVIDGEVVVLESWKGALAAGERITVPELAAFAAAERRAVAPRWGRRDEAGPALVTGRRMILFLTPHPHSLACKSVGVAWVEGGELFAFVQTMNPGPSVLIAIGIGENEAAKVVGNVVAASRVVEEVRAGEPPDAAYRFVCSATPMVRHFMIAALGKAGPNGAAVLRDVLLDASRLEDHADAITALAEAAGAEAAPELIGVLEQELALWKRIGPDLKVGWWNDLSKETAELSALRAHYSRSYAALGALKTMRDPRSREVVLAFRDLWRSLPQLGTHDQILRECDLVLLGVD